MKQFKIGIEKTKWFSVKTLRVSIIQKRNHMKKLIRISRLASKEAIKDLKAKNPLYCSAIKEDFTVTNIFYSHIIGYKKSRPDREVVERLIVMNLIQKIAQEWVLKEKRKNGAFEWAIYQNTYKIMLKKWWICFYVIIWEEKSGKYILLSCFVKDYRKNKDSFV